MQIKKHSRQAAFVTLLSFVGISLLIGDGFITPAISILSAAEGLDLFPGYENTGRDALILIACFIAVILFAFQKKLFSLINGLTPHLVNFTNCRTPNRLVLSRDRTLR